MSSRLRELLGQFHPELPLERAKTIPSSWYSDLEFYEAERRAVFGDTWQVVGRTDQVGSPGAFLTADVAGEPILVVRGDDGLLRAFSNVCRHRAARVMAEPEGTATKLRCRYHGWTYDLTGKLRGVPEFDGVADFCREDNGLAPLSVDTWGPLVFVHSSTNPPPLAEFLAPLPERCAALNLDSLEFVERRSYTLECNWKIFVDNYLDGGYHVNTIHPGLAGVLDYSQYRTTIAGNTSVQTSPLRAPDPSHDDTSAGAVRKGDTAYYWWLFPNFMLNHYGAAMDTNLVLPLGTHRCQVVFDFYFSKDRSPEEKQGDADSIAVAHQIQLEDVGICEEVQRGLASRSFDTGRFSVKREIAGYYFHQLLARKLASSAVGAAPRLK